jgi:putative ATPase
METHLAPLPERMRPKSFEDFVGQEHLLGEGKVLKSLIEKGNIPSIIFWGPPGVGKTSLAQFIAQKVNLPFYQLSAIDSGVKDVRAILEKAKTDGKAILFIDEIHRFNKSQQDSLLGAVEKGIIILIGATTENPSFEVISALLSRCQVYTLKALEIEDLNKLLIHALTTDIVLKEKKVVLKETEALLKYSGGDARKLLNVLELVCNQSIDEITNDLVEKVVQTKMAIYDKSGEMHYDVISAFIKSIRGSDPNAALYYLARMTAGGEDPKFIARRLLILASEDIGNANPTAMVMANNCFQAVNVIGYPECDLILGQTVIYLATSPKSNASYLAIKKAQQLVKETGDLPIPLHLRNAPTKLMKDLNYGTNYKYAHDYEGNFAMQDFLPDKIKKYSLYKPGKNQREQEVKKWLEFHWKDYYQW